MKIQSSLLLVATFAASTLAAPTSIVQPVSCTLPDTSGSFQTAVPGQLNINETILKQAISDASGQGATSIKVFRNNCLVGQSEKTSYTDPYLKNLFSATKGVISILAGIAYDQGKLGLDDAIDKYLPTGPGWGDAIHRSVTVRQLLQENAGQAKGVTSEGLTVLLDQSLPQEALAQQQLYPPGQMFQYSQRVPDLLAYVVARAVGQELQAFAQTTLFGPLGIPRNSYIWFRDRSGNSYGYAYLYMSPTAFAKIGLMMQNGGTYNGQRILSKSYVDMVHVPSPTNGCYGLLFWTNTGDTCVSPTGYQFGRSWIPSAPRDLFAMSGSPDQKNFMIPSLNMTVSFMGVLTDSAPPADLWYKFFKTLMPGILDQAPFDPKTFDLDQTGINGTLQAASLNVLLADLVSSPQCNIVICNNNIPLGGLLGNIPGLLGLTVNSLGSLLNLGW